MKKIGILGIDNDNVTYGCPVCFKNKEDVFKRIVPVSEIVVYKPDGDILFGKLPPCPKCGSLSFVTPNNISDTVPAHLRRVVVARAIDNEQLMKGSSKEDAGKCREKLKEFYTKKGDASLDDEFEGKVKVKKFVDGREKDKGKDK
jgi:hypothetical protein